MNVLFAFKLYNKQERKMSKKEGKGSGGNRWRVKFAERLTSFHCLILFIICKRWNLIKRRKRKAKQGRIRRKTSLTTSVPMSLQNYRCKRTQQKSPRVSCLCRFTGQRTFATLQNSLITTKLCFYKKTGARYSWLT